MGGQGRAHSAGKNYVKYATADEFAKLGRPISDADQDWHFKPTGRMTSVRNEIAALLFLANYPKIPSPDMEQYHISPKRVELATFPRHCMSLSRLEQSQPDVCREVEREMEEICDRMQDVTSSEACSFIGPICNTFDSCKFLHQQNVKAFANVDDGYPLCHGQLQPRNILVNHNSGKVAIILDWEFAGFYPPALEVRSHPYRPLPDLDEFRRCVKDGIYTPSK